MKKIRTILVGLGSVNIGLLKILCEKKDEIAEKHGFELSVVGVADSSGVAVSENGFSYQELIDLKSGGSSVSELKGHVSTIPAEATIKAVETDLVVEASPAELKTGDPGLSVVRNALEMGLSVVTANKAPLVFAFDELHRLAEKHGGRLAFSAAVCGGLPVINVLKRDLRATELIGLEGVFNATSNFILEELEHGRSFDNAVMEAQRVGAAETDPSLDIDGYDAANKLYIIMKCFSEFSGTLSDVEITGIRAVTPETIAEAAARKKRIKLVAAAERENGKWCLSVAPGEIDRDSFLGNCDGWEMGIQIKTDYYENLAMKIREEEPVSTCAAVLRDIINISTD
ncbi:MAG: homoserine dehydrogenase [Pyrinomonadaceae bacterium]|nr:homoserine dehydrogenase [Pyrinomonadaceae bacterium]